jgi:hypothetical protein
MTPNAETPLAAYAPYWGAYEVNAHTNIPVVHQVLL